MCRWWWRCSNKCTSALYWATQFWRRFKWRRWWGNTRQLLSSSAEVRMRTNFRKRSTYWNNWRREILNFDACASNTADDTLPSSSKRIYRVHLSKPDLPIPAANRDSKFTWCKDNSIALLPIFPGAVYEDCVNLRPHQLFEKFFNDDLLEHICKCSILYATHHQKCFEKLSVRGMELEFLNVFLYL